jgi:hypothetical protein
MAGPGSVGGRGAVRPGAAHSRVEDSGSRVTK